MLQITPSGNTIRSEGFTEPLNLTAWRVSAYYAPRPVWEAPMKGPEQLHTDDFSVLRMCILSHSVSVLSIKIELFISSMNFKCRSYSLHSCVPENVRLRLRAEVLVPAPADTEPPDGVSRLGSRLAPRLPQLREFPYRRLPPTSNSD